MSLFWISRDKLPAFLHELHKPSFRSIDSIEMRLMKDGLISIWVDVNFKYRFHQLVASEIQVEFVFKHMLFLNI